MIVQSAAADLSNDPAAVTRAVAAEVDATSARKTSVRLGVARETLNRILRGKPVHPGTIALVREALAQADRK